MTELAKSFEPAAIEARWGPLWEARGAYGPTLDPARPSFSIQLPPPNVTGTLHMGHAFNQTIMDALTRYHRMRGFNTLWVPGTDHAGIATQIVVERQLQDQKASAATTWAARTSSPRSGNGRRQSATPSRTQMRRMGDSVDWAHEYFTMDDKLSHGRHRDLRAPVRAGPDLPRQAPGELGPGAASPPCPTSRWKARRKTASSGTSAIPLADGSRRADGGHHAARDHARRRRGDGASRGRALRRTWSASRCGCRCAIATSR